ncbi:MAG: BrnT family toxin [Verrucomicrobia bacterium]|nr:BrnT family toxin [Leptolyngbya sp. ES-bin-22]
MSILDDISQAFDPSPLPAGSAVYVDCRAVRGGSDILVELGKKVLRSDRTCQLYSGHRGGGKSTELLRLQAELDKRGCFVVYFAAEDGDINPEDVEYTDISKHRVSFDRAAIVFLDPNARSILDVDHSEEEDRWATLGIDNTWGTFMNDEHDFSAGERGKFYHPQAELALSIYLDPESATFLRNLAAAKGIDVETIVNDWIKKNIALIETAMQP